MIDVPLIIGAPGVAGREIDSVTRSIDVFPALAGLAGVELPGSAPVSGVDLSSALRASAALPTLVADSHGTLRQWSYDPSDPTHRRNAAELWQYRASMIQAYLEQKPDEATSRQQDLGSLTEEQLRALRSLGYIE